MSTTTPNRLIGRVTRLVEQAASESELEERLSRADQIMAAHLLEEAQARVMQKAGERRKPINLDVTELVGQDPRMQRFADRVARTVCVRLVHHRRQWFLVGFQEDVAWAQLLFTSLQRVYASYLDPQWETDRDFDMNLVVLRESGMSWSQVLDRAVEAGAVEDTWTGVRSHTDRATGRTWNSTKARWSAEDKLNLAYRNWCRANDREPVQIRRHAEYRDAYPKVVARWIQAFLDQMRTARHQDDTTAAKMLLDSVGQEVEAAVKDLTTPTTFTHKSAGRRRRVPHHHTLIRAGV